MSLAKVSAIFNEFRLPCVEKALIKHGVNNFTLTYVQGRSDHFHDLSNKHLIKHVQMDIYTHIDQADAIARLIAKTAHVNAESEGLVAILPVSQLYWVHEQREANANDFTFKELNND